MERAKRLEARNITEEEQEMALAAPAAREKRDRAPRIDYKALATRGRGKRTVGSSRRTAPRIARG